jgi:SAM-dependent methyltransferase
MNWGMLLHAPWLDTRAKFVFGAPKGGKLLDLGSSDGETLGHIAELRPDLKLCACDIAGSPDRYPAGCDFHRSNLEHDRLPWQDSSIDAITCMHVIEHIANLENVLEECVRLLKVGGRVYFETPHPKTVIYSSPKGRNAGRFTLNFFDDVTHIRPISVGGLAVHCRSAGLGVVDTGISRNLLFAASFPLFALMPASRRKYTAKTHWLGWSAYLIAERVA